MGKSTSYLEALCLMKAWISVQSGKKTFSAKIKHRDERGSHLVTQATASTNCHPFLFTAARRMLRTSGNSALLGAFAQRMLRTSGNSALLGAFLLWGSGGIWGSRRTSGNSALRTLREAAIPFVHFHETPVHGCLLLVYPLPASREGNFSSQLHFLTSLCC